MTPEEATQKLFKELKWPYTSEFPVLIYDEVIEAIQSNSPRADYIRVLISEGADVNAKNDYTWTPLMYAVGYTNGSEIVTLLIEAGADVIAKDGAGWTPLMYAARFSKTPEIVTLLIEAGADVNAKGKDGRTPLMDAYKLEIRQILKAAGAKE